MEENKNIGNKIFEGIENISEEDWDKAVRSAEIEKARRMLIRLKKEENQKG